MKATRDTSLWVIKVAYRRVPNEHWHHGVQIDDMNSACRRLLIEKIEALLVERFGDVKIAKVEKSILYPKSWIVSRIGRLNIFFVLIHSPKMEEFTVEVAWSGLNNVPNSVQMLPDFECLASEGRFRMSRIWDSTGAEVWYNLNFNDDEMRFIYFTPVGEDVNTRAARISAKALNVVDTFELKVLPCLNQRLSCFA